MDLELAKTLYFRELDRRSELDGAPTFRVAILALLGGVYSYYVQHFKPAHDFMSAMFLGATAATVVFAALAVVWIIRSYSGYTWAYLPFADQLQAHYESLVEYHAQYPSDTLTAEQLFEGHLRLRLIEAAARNALNNTQRSELMYRAGLFLSLAVVFSLLAGLPLLSQALAAALR